MMSTLHSKAALFAAQDLFFPLSSLSSLLTGLTFLHTFFARHFLQDQRLYIHSSTISYIYISNSYNSTSQPSATFRLTCRAFLTSLSKPLHSFKMKTTFAHASMVLALLSSGNVFAHEHYCSLILTLFVSATAQNTDDGCGDCSGVCVNFSATSDDLWYWWNGGPGGDPTNFGSQQIGSVCLTDAGAMFVGNSESVAGGGGNTKFEWYVGDSTSNFDVSVCDGFSVPMTCTNFQGNESPYVTIGGGALCEGDCPDQSGANCLNLGSHTGNLSDVPSCFKDGAGAEGESGENNYWMYDNYSVQSIFTGRSGVTCTVGGWSSKEKRAEVGDSTAELAPRASKHRQHGHERRAHGHGLHAVS